jgi:hypothetical protein
MNAFETIVAQFLERKGYWVRQSVKVNISKEDKVRIGKPSMPRPEIDLVALNVAKNELLLVEAKSYLDSYGVYLEGVTGEDERDAERYKLFTKEVFRKIVTKRLRSSYKENGLINTNTKTNYALAAGKIRKGNEDALQSYFDKKGWILFTPREIKEEIVSLSNEGWEDNLVNITAKLVIRGT